MLSYRKLAMRVLGRPLHTGGIDSPRPASQRAAAFILTAAMLTTLAAPAFADIWRIEDGDITVKAGETKGTNKVSQGTTIDKVDTNTIITGTSDTNTVTIDTSKGNVDVTFDDLNIDASSRNEAAMSVTGSGNTTIKLDGDNHLTGGNGDTYGGDGIASTGSLTISGGETDSLTAQGGSGENGGDGITSSGSLTISGGTVTATGGNSTGIVGSGGSGIHSGGDVTISGGTVTATGGDSTGSDGSGGYGIYSSSTTTISGGTVTATGGDSTGSDGSGGYGIYSSGVTISGGSTVTANGGSGKDGSGTASSASTLSPSPAVPSRPKAAAVKTAKTAATASAASTLSPSPAVPSRAKGGSGEDGSGGRGIISTKSVTISGGTVNANGGSGKNGNGGNGIIGSGRVAISGGTVEAAGGNGGKVGGSVIDLSGSLELTAKAGSPNGKALSQRGKELDLNTIKDKLGPGAKVTTTDADGKVIDQVPIPRPVEPEESSSSSDGGSATPSAPASPLPGLTVTDKSGAVISYTSTQSGNTLTVCVGRFTASFRISLAALRQLRAEGIETITFQTILCSTTLSVDELLAMGGEDAEAVLTHRSTDSSLTVG